MGLWILAIVGLIVGVILIAEGEAGILMGSLLQFAAVVLVFLLGGNWAESTTFNSELKVLTRDWSIVEVVGDSEAKVQRKLPVNGKDVIFEADMKKDSALGVWAIFAMHSVEKARPEVNERTKVLLRGWGTKSEGKGKES